MSAATLAPTQLPPLPSGGPRGGYGWCNVGSKSSAGGAVCAVTEGLAAPDGGRKVSEVPKCRREQPGIPLGPRGQRSILILTKQQRSGHLHLLLVSYCEPGKSSYCAADMTTKGIPPGISHKAGSQTCFGVIDHHELCTCIRCLDLVISFRLFM